MATEHPELAGKPDSPPAAPWGWYRWRVVNKEGRCDVVDLASAPGGPEPLPIPNEEADGYVFWCRGKLQPVSNSRYHWIGQVICQCGKRHLLLPIFKAQVRPAPNPPGAFDMPPIAEGARSDLEVDALAPPTMVPARPPEHEDAPENQ